MSTDSLKELWVAELLPEHRKLKYLNQRPLDHLVSSTSSLSSHQNLLLLLWFFEDQVKSRYLQFITTLQVGVQYPGGGIKYPGWYKIY